MPENTVTLNIDAKYGGRGRNSIKNVKKDLTDTASSLKKAERAADNFGDEAQSAGRQAERGLKGTSIATVALGNALGSLIQHAVRFGALAAKSFIGAAITMERLLAALTATVGDAGVAEKQMERLLLVAQKPGLGLQEAVQGSINLQAVGVNAEFAARMLEEVGNALAAAGKGKIELQEITRQLQKVIATQKLEHESVQILIERMPALAKVLKSTFGTITAAGLRERGVSYSQFVNTVLQGLSKLERVGKTTSNALENFQDNVFQVSAKLGAVFLPTINQILDSISGLLDKIIALSDTETKILVWGATSAAALAGLGAAINTLAWALPALTAGIAKLGVALTWLSAHPIVAVGVALVALIAIIYKYREAIAGTATVTDELGKAIIENNIDDIKEYLSQAEDEMFSMMKNILSLERQLVTATSTFGADSSIVQAKQKELEGLKRRYKDLNEQVEKANKALAGRTDAAGPEGLPVFKGDAPAASTKKTEEQKALEKLNDFRKAIRRADSTNQIATLQKNFGYFVEDNKKRIDANKELSDTVIAIQKYTSEQLAKYTDIELRGDETERERQRAEDLGKAREEIAREVASLNKELIEATTREEVIAIRGKLIEVRRSNQEELQLAVDLSRLIVDLTQETGRRETALRLKESNEQATAHLRIVDTTLSQHRQLTNQFHAFVQEVRKAETAEELRQARYRLDIWKRNNELIIKDNRIMATSLAGLYKIINERTVDVLGDQILPAPDPDEMRQKNESMMNVIAGTADLISNIPFDFVSRMRERNEEVKWLEEELLEVARLSSQEKQRISEDEYLTAVQKQQKLVALERRTAQQREGIENDLADARTNVFSAMVSDFIKDMARLVAAEAKRRAVEGLVNLGANLLSGGVTSLIPGGAGGLATAGASLLSGIFDNPTHDSMLSQSGRSQAQRESLYASKILGRQQARDMTQAFMSGYKEVKMGQAQAPVTKVEVKPIFSRDMIRWYEDAKEHEVRRGRV